MFSELVNIGNEVASIWGGYCKRAEIDMQGQKVNFLCVERGEEFYTSLSFDELHRDYNLNI